MRSPVLPAVLLLALACGRGATRFVVQGDPDAGGAPDAADAEGTPDAGPADATGPDAGSPDTSIPDAGTPDAGTPDAGAPDAGPITFSAVRASPRVAGHGTEVLIQATASRTIQDAPSLSVDGRAARFESLASGRQLTFSFTPDLALDAPGDARVAFNEGALLTGVLRLDFSGADAGSLADAGVDVLTRGYDQARTGAYLGETALEVGSVNPGSFGKLFTLAVDGQTYAQPLYLDSITIGGAPRDVLYIATEHDSVYAFDADHAGAPLWQVSLGTPVPSTALSCNDLTPEVGITSTPVIDRAAGLLYAVAKTQETDGVHLRLHALDLATGEERLDGPVELSPPGPPSFTALYQHQRASLLLFQGAIWIGFASHCDLGPYHGWVLAYDAATLSPVGAWTPAPDDTGAGIWQSGHGLSADETGVYVTMGNGLYSAPRNLGNSVARLTLGPSGIAVADSFTPSDQARMQRLDIDLGSTQALLIPGTNLAVAGSKGGDLFLLDRGALGGFDPRDSGLLQRLHVADRVIHGGLAFWSGPAGPTVYVFPVAGRLQAFALAGGRFEAAPASERADTATGRSMALSISADGARHGTGIVWATQDGAGGDGLLRAFDAEDVSRELWNSDLVPARDGFGAPVKFVPPTVAQGKVYAGSRDGKISVYGLLGD